MATIDITRHRLATGVAGYPEAEDVLFDDLFGPRTQQGVTWHFQQPWVGAMLGRVADDASLETLDRLSEVPQATAPEPMPLTSSEVSLALVSRARGRVAIALTDEQADQLIKLHSEDAFS